MEWACYSDPNKDNKIIVIFGFPDMTIKSFPDNKNKLRNIMGIHYGLWVLLERLYLDKLLQDSFIK